MSYQPQRPRMDTEAIKRSAQYKQVRIALLLIIIFSVANIFMVLFADSYFLFSSYISQLISIVGVTIYAETQETMFLVITIALGIASVVPYILFYIFSKKKVGWMIAALVVFSIDSVLFMLDFISIIINAGDFSMFIDLAIRIYVLVTLILGVKYGSALEKKNPNGSNLEYKPELAPQNMPESENADELNERSAVTRTLTLTRQKRFAGCAIALTCYIDGRPACSFKNGERHAIEIDGNAHEVAVMDPSAKIAGSIMMPEGDNNKSYAFEIKMGMWANSIVFTEQP